VHLWTTVTSVLPCSDRSAARDQIELRKLFGLIGKDFECHTGDILITNHTLDRSSTMMNKM